MGKANEDINKNEINPEGRDTPVLPSTTVQENATAVGFGSDTEATERQIPTRILDDSRVHLQGMIISKRLLIKLTYLFSE